MPHSHTRQTDTELLIKFTKDQGFDEQGLMDAVERLEKCHKEELQDYGLPVKSHNGEEHE